MLGAGGWRIPKSAGRWLLCAVGIVTVAWSTALLPSGCEGRSRTTTTLNLPASPLDGRPHLTGPQPAPAVIASPTPERPKPPALRPTIPQSEPSIRIRVASSQGDAIVLSHPSGWLWVKAESASSGCTVRTPVSFRPASDGWNMIESVGTSLASRMHIKSPPSDSLLIAPPKGSSKEIHWQGGVWPGDAILVRRSDSNSDGADLVFAVPIEQYLPGVLAKELYKGWSHETFLAQAVAARSYALCEHAWWKGRRHFDVVAGQASQAWIGSTADPASCEAVRETAGQYLVFEGRVVPAYYSSCCGGIPAAATDAIREGSWMDISPLDVDGSEDARPKNCCEKAPTAKWTVSMKSAALANRLNAWAQQEGRQDLGSLSGVKSIILAEANPAGRPVSYRITDSRGRKVLWDAEDFRYAVNAGATGSKDSLKSGFFSPRVERGTVTLSGRGHGHGSGMCQFGAQAMGKSGRNYREILRRYYPGAVVESAPVQQEFTSDAISPTGQAAIP